MAETPDGSVTEEPLFSNLTAQGRHPPDLVKALRAIAEQHDDERGPLVPYARQNGAEGAAIFRGGIGELDGHFGVLR